MLLFQQRAPVIEVCFDESTGEVPLTFMEGKHNSFVEGLMKWIQTTSVQQILLLTSTDAAFRYTEGQLSGSQVRWMTSQSPEKGQRFEKVATEKHWTEIENVSVSEVLKRGTVTQILYSACEKVRIWNRCPAQG